MDVDGDRKKMESMEAAMARMQADHALQLADLRREKDEALRLAQERDLMLQVLQEEGARLRREKDEAVQLAQDRSKVATNELV